MAAFLKEKLGIEVQIIEGDRGEFTVWVGEQMVAKKGWIRFPSNDKVLTAVREALAI